jgi:hypothetical protein
MTQLNKKAKYLSEMLDEANKSSNPIQSLKDMIVDDPRLNTILGYAINPKWKISTVLPDGVPPYKDSDLPLGMADLDLLKLHNKLYILFNPRLKQYKKEEFFIKWIESMHPTDVSIFVAVKDQNLESLYPNLTRPVVYSALGWTKEQYNSLFM